MSSAVKIFGDFPDESSYPEFPLLLSLSHSYPLVSTICEQLSKSARDVSGNFRTVAPSVGRFC